MGLPVVQIGSEFVRGLPIAGMEAPNGLGFLLQAERSKARLERDRTERAPSGQALGTRDGPVATAEGGRGRGTRSGVTTGEGSGRGTAPSPKP